jgi:L-iditol 2-dehydrogenase
MKALVHVAPNKFEIQDFPKPAPGPREVLLRVKACGICGSDIHGMTGHTGRRIPPIIMGHEATGVIEEAGGAVKNFKVGDRVTFDSTVFCNDCAYCLQGLVNLCSNRMVVGVSPGEYRKHGAMAEYVTLPEQILYKLPDTVGFHQGALIEPLSISMHAVNRGHLRINEKVVVLGCGIIGLMAIQCARLNGCGTLIAIDMNEARLEMARKVGADITINPTKEKSMDVILANTKGEGADAVFDAVGLDKTANDALSYVRKGGKLILIGNLTPSAPFGLQSVVTREITIYGSCASAGEYQDCVDMIGSGRIKVDQYISKVAPLEEGQVWFDRLLSGKEPLYKVILEP